MSRAFPDRRFQFWMYRVSHGELLVRSPRDFDHDDNIDLIFVGVKYVDLPRRLEGVEIDTARPEDLLWLAGRVGQAFEASKVVVLQTGECRHLVVASRFKVEVNQLDLFELPFD